MVAVYYNRALKGKLVFVIYSAAKGTSQKLLRRAKNDVLSNKVNNGPKRPLNRPKWAKNV